MGHMSAASWCAACYTGTLLAERTNHLLACCQTCSSLRGLMPLVRQHRSCMHISHADCCPALQLLMWTLMLRLHPKTAHLYAVL